MKKYVSFKAVGITVFASLLIVFTLYNNCIGNKFTKEKWNSHPEKRYKILDSLLEQHKIIGLNKDEVHELLGSEACTSNDDMIEYYISQGLGDPVVFIIYFDSDGIVYNCEVYSN